MKVLDGGGASSPIVFYCGKKGIDITTLDLQESLVENTKKVANKMGWNTITAIKRDMTDTGFPNNYFDAIISISVFEHLPEPLRPLQEFKRLLRPVAI
jgi:ubiquinone/menaquinone biosynthesis C-methylase UbiE